VAAFLVDLRGKRVGLGGTARVVDDDRKAFTGKAAR
jgi:hypothetical protein